MSPEPLPTALDFVADHLLRLPLYSLSTLTLSAPLCRRLQNLLLLRRLAANPLSLKTLHLLHQPLSPSFAAAYFAIALRSLARGDDACARRLLSRVSTFEAATGIEGIGMLRRVIEVVLVDEEVRRELAGGNLKAQAVEAVRVFLRDEWKRMGKSFLEVAAETVVTNGIELKDDGEECSTRPVGVDGELSLESHETVDKHIEGEAASTSKNNVLQTTGIRRVADALKSSCAHLRRAVDDPLPGAIKAAMEAINLLGQVRIDNRNTDKVQEGAKTPACIDKGKEVAATVGGTKETSIKMDSHGLNMEQTAVKQMQENENKRIEEAGVVKGTGDKAPCANADGVVKYSLMDRNPTARTFEWEDSVDSLPEASSSLPKKRALPRPMRREVSLLKIDGNKNSTKRRKHRKWSVLEEDTLRKAVSEFGVGCWKFILQCNSDIFEERTEVDLKDKWRNMTRR